MTVTSLSPDFAVSPQVEPRDVPALAEAGFVHIVNNRPDGEEPGQPTSEQIAAAAASHGLGYSHIPIVPGQATQANAEALAAVLRDAPGPVLGFCRSGGRARQLWEMARHDKTGQG